MSTAMPPFWRQVAELHRLVGIRCKQCGRILFPAKKICIECGGTEFEEVPISRRGKIVTYVICHLTPKGIEAPVPLAIVETEDGAKLTGFVTEYEPDEVKVNMSVESVFRRIGEQNGRINYGFKFRPLREKPQS